MSRKKHIGVQRLQEKQDTKKTIIDNFQSESAEELYKKLTNGDEEKCTRFKQIFIDLVWKNQEIGLMKRKTWEKFKEDIEKGMNSDILIDSHDDIITTKELEEYKDEEETDQGIEDRTYAASNEENTLRKEDFVYEIQKGLALVLWNTDFLKPNTDTTDRSRRKIGDEDRYTMGKILPHFNIEVFGQEDFEKGLPSKSGGNLLKEEVTEVIEVVRERIDEKKPDIFICVVSTHANEVVEAKTGDNGGMTCVRQMLSFKDGALGKAMGTDELVSEFSDTNCPSLQGKPRLFFIEACRSRVSEGTKKLAACKLSIKQMEEGIENFKTNIEEEKRKLQEYENGPGDRTEEIRECRVQIQEYERLIEENEESITRKKLTIAACKIIQIEENIVGLPGDMNVQTTIRSNVKTDCKENVDKAEAMPAMSVKDEAENQYKAKHENKPLQGGAGNVDSSSNLPEAPQTNDPINTTQDGTDESVLVDVVPYEVSPSPCYNDCLIMYAAPPGKTAYGRVNFGGWMIGTLHDVLAKRKSSPEIDILDVLTEVCDRVVKKMEYTDKDGKSNIEWQIKVVPCIEHKLLKDVTLKTKKQTD